MKKTLVILIIILAVLLALGIGYYRNHKNIQEPLSELNPQKISLGERYFYYETPDNADTNTPVIIMLHGRSQTALGWFDISENLATEGQNTFTREALANGFAVIAPQSAEAFCPGKNQWDSQSKTLEESEDLQFFENILDWINKNPQLDTKRVYVVGLSSGAAMTSRVATYFGKEKINAVVIHSGAHADKVTLAYHPEKVLKCEVSFSTDIPNISSTHPRTLLIHGSGDNLDPFEAAQAYDKGLTKAGIEHKFIIKEDGKHTWYSEYNNDIISWFSQS